jgi:hypothetical protein
VGLFVAIGQKLLGSGGSFLVLPWAKGGASSVSRNFPYSPQGNFGAYVVTEDENGRSVFFSTFGLPLLEFCVMTVEQVAREINAKNDGPNPGPTG